MSPIRNTPSNSGGTSARQGASSTENMAVSSSPKLSPISKKQQEEEEAHRKMLEARGIAETCPATLTYDQVKRLEEPELKTAKRLVETAIKAKKGKTTDEETAVLILLDEALMWMQTADLNESAQDSDFHLLEQAKAREEEDFARAHGYDSGEEK